MVSVYCLRNSKLVSDNLAFQLLLRFCKIIRCVIVVGFDRDMLKINFALELRFP